MPATAISGKGVFGPGFMAGVADMASPIPGLVSPEVIEALGPALRQRTSIAAMWVEAVVDVAVKAARTVKPRPSPNEHTSSKPVRTVVSVRRTIVRWIVKVSVRAYGGCAKVNADGNLGMPHRCRAEKGSSKSCERKRVDFEHGLSSIDSESKNKRGVVFPPRFSSNFYRTKEAKLLTAGVCRLIQVRCICLRTTTIPSAARTQTSAKQNALA
jgi:hypothetical protein